MSEEDFDKITKKFTEYNEIFGKLHDWVVRIEWQAGEGKLKELGDEFKVTNAHVEGIKSQLSNSKDLLKNGRMEKDQFESKLGALVGELSNAEFDLHKIKPKIKQFIIRMKEFVDNKGINEEGQKVLGEMAYILTKFETGSDIGEKGGADIKESDRDREVRREIELRNAQKLKELREPCEDNLRKIRNDLDETRKELSDTRYNLKWAQEQLNDLKNNINMTIEDDAIKKRLLGI